LKNAKYIIGNSSAGIREACVYGIPCIDIGTRQNNRYPLALKNIIHVDEDYASIVNAINNISDYCHRSCYYGDGNSAGAFLTFLKKIIVGENPIQKEFVDMDSTQMAIKNYINEVCY
jgi:UDP-N-acetylglucosamine 2-epimerase (hydrolysing)